LSPDGSKLAVGLSNPAEQLNVWIYDPTSGAGRPLNRDGEFEDRPEWTPDGKRVLYRAQRGDRYRLLWKSVDGPDSATVLAESPGKPVWEGVLSHDGRTLVYRTGTVGDADIWYRTLPDTFEHPIATSSAAELGMRLSPDGRWLAYHSNESGVDEVYVQPFPGPGARTAVSVGGGRTPVWAPSGRELFYFSGRRFMSAKLSLPVSSSSSVTVVGRQEIARNSYFPGNGHAPFDVTRDGEHFIMLRTLPGEGERVVLVLNWTRRLLDDSLATNR
jgi:eukaryotic-like serine/threonine-protein kinase